MNFFYLAHQKKTLSCLRVANVFNDLRYNKVECCANCFRSSILSEVKKERKTKKNISTKNKGVRSQQQG